MGHCENLPMSKMDGPFDKSLRETNFLLILSLGNLLKVKKKIDFGCALINLITRYLNQTVLIEDGIRHAGCAQLVLMIIS